MLKSFIKNCAPMCRLISLSVLVSCTTVGTLDYFGNMPTGGSAERVFLTNLEFSPDLIKWSGAQKIPLKDWCAQKVVYRGEKNNAVMFELHAKKCASKLLDMPILVSEWKYSVSEKDLFQKSEFMLDGKKLGASVDKSDVIASLCNSSSANQCTFTKNDKGQYTVALSK